MSKHALTVIVAVIIAVSLLLYMFAFQVRTSETAVVLTFGRPAPKPPSAGYHFKWPWPIQEVRRFDNRVHVQEGRFEETYTRDRYNIIVSLCTGWKISDPLKFNENFGRATDPIGQAWVSIERIVRDRTLAVLGRHDLHEMVTVDAKQLKYGEIEQETLDAASLQARQTYGVELVLVKFRRLELPESVTAKVYERMKSERNREAQTIKSGGEQAAAVIRANAEAQRDQILARARAEAEKLKGEGDAEAARYYRVFAENPDLAIYLRKIRALKEAVKNSTTIVVDTHTPPFDLLVEGPPEPKAAAPVAKDAASGK